MPNGRPRVAAVPYRQPPDAAMAALAREMWRRGAVVGGLLHRLGPPPEGGGEPAAHLDSLRGGRSHRLDLEGALDRAAQDLRDAVRARCDLLLVGRFGPREAERLRECIAEAARGPSPLVVAVAEEHLGTLARLLGEPPQRVPPLAEALLAWAEERVREGVV